MSDEFNVLKEKYPRLVPSGQWFECGPGWVGVLDRYFADVEVALPEDILFHISQIKEKFGILTIYAHPEEGVAPEVSYALMRAETLAEARSVRTCEKCGKSGRLLVRKHWFYTACKEHADGGEPARMETSPSMIGGKRLAYDETTDTLIEVPEAG